MYVTKLEVTDPQATDHLMHQVIYSLHLSAKCTFSKFQNNNLPAVEMETPAVVVSSGSGTGQAE